MNHAITIFGDEIGLPVIVEAIASLDQRPFVQAVYDPTRAGMEEMLAGQDGIDEILPHPSKANRESFVRKLSHRQPSLAVVYSYSRILWQELIDIFPCGVVNLHGGKLPEFRGANVLQWAIIEGQAETAVTLHYIEDQRVDSGPIIADIPIAIPQQATALDVRNEFRPASLKLLQRWLPQLLQGRVAAKPQNETAARAWPRRTPADGKIDWAASDQEIYNLIRALVVPWPGAYYEDAAATKHIINHKLSMDEIAALRKQVAPLTC